MLSKALLFDLGNVLLPINLDLTYQAFANYSSRYTFDEIKKLTYELSLWTPYESGQQSDEEFRHFLKKELFLHCTDAEFDQAFNALLLNFHKETHDVLSSLKSNFEGIYLLSNTSYIHFCSYRNEALSSNHDIFNLFDQLFLSFNMGLVKPDPAIYKTVSQKINKSLTDIIFFDDNEFNVESALQLGIDAHLIEPKHSISQIKETLAAYVNA